MKLLRTLAGYAWEAKVVLTLAAFAVYNGEFRLVAQLRIKDPSVKYVAILKQLSVEHQLQAIDNIIESIIKVTKCIVEYCEMIKSNYIPEDTPPNYIPEDTLPLLDIIPAPVFLVLRGILACAFHISDLTQRSRDEYTKSTEEYSGELPSHFYENKDDIPWELKELPHLLDERHQNIEKKRHEELTNIKKKRHEEYYKNLICLFQDPHQDLDNVKYLRALISQKADTRPLEIGTSKSRFNLERLRWRQVLLLISDLSLSNEEIVNLDHIYKERQNRAEVEYEIVWLPVVDATTWDEAKRFRFEELKSKMPWYAVHDPLIIEPPVIKFIRNDWHFDKKMIIVSLDPQGRVSSLNAIHMLWVWGNLAFPFTDEKDQVLWNAESWRLQLVADGIDPTILDWIEKGKYICLYGGDDLEWIRKFTVRAKVVAGLAGISLELLYVGRSTATRERIRKVNKVIETENLSRFWPDYTSNWFFWSRMDSMRCSKAKHHKTVKNDEILKEVMTLLSYDGSGGGWVMVWRGSNETARANGPLTLLTLDDFEAWKNEAAKSGFVPTLKDELKRRHTPDHCIRLIIPGFGPDIPDRVECPDCGREMEKFLKIRCCTD
ncbi:PREDICTED: protein SIEVE ELEMENT OCCLUSION B-like [Prunus mume]|uniref:Protein SIEVE ELEMENT OCCLUSION B-like n=1 Tax=Prunus mume TaxID=102107 RepID=A0ABM0PH96_PRUMU|nr:PREDICTED: protein SIEVE ELEMENT OCCLUSION B-like [Prunus mume]